MTIDIVINGALGRMGRQIAAVALADEQVCLAGCIESKQHPALGADIGDMLGMGKKNVAVVSSLKEIAAPTAVIIDFTTPRSTQAVIRETAGTGMRLVIGTTGLDDADQKLMHDVSRTNALLFSPNMSFGVNFLFYLTQIAAEKMGRDYDIEIIEAHHRHKKDAPSGTAKMLGEIAATAIGRSYAQAVQDGRRGITGERPAGEIGMHAVRGGDIVGDHTVLFAGDGERLELKHAANNRAAFARGAVKAAKWLHPQHPGLYSMRDVLGI